MILQLNYKIIETFRKIVNILQYIPVLWKDNSTDFKYTYNILLFKIQKQIKLYEHEYEVSLINAGYYIKKLKQLKFCEKILIRLIENTYFTQDRNDLTEIFNKDILTQQDVTKSQNIIDFKYKSYYKQKQRDKKLLYSMFEKYSDTWWI